MVSGSNSILESSSSSSSGSSNCDSSNSDSSNSRSSNSAHKNQDPAPFDKLSFDNSPLITRVWICRKTISLYDEHVFREDGSMVKNMGKGFLQLGELFLGRDIYHWAVILELSNNCAVNIQFGRDGTSLKIFSSGNKFENVAQAIRETWGQKNASKKFCFLGKPRKVFNEIYYYLEEKKREEKLFGVFYNLITYNCQLFAVEVEKEIFGIKKLVR